MKLDMDDKVIMKELNALVKETFLLWDVAWVDFSWRHYYYNHTQRIRALCLEIGRQEGADLRKLEYASLLHDITKRYDGSIIRDSQGKRIIDKNGFWHNELLLPKRENLVSKLYKKFNQFHTLHNVSSALISKKILESYSLSSNFCASVSSIIESHLKPDASDNLEKKILYEADTMDANLGLIAFYRNIQIHTHIAKIKNGRAYLKKYVDRIEPWINRTISFINNMKTESGTRIANKRYKRMKDFSSNVIKEFKHNFTQSLKYGLLDIIKGFMDQNQDPNLQEEIKYLLTRWIPEHRKLINSETDPKIKTIFQRATRFCQLLSKEIEGKI